ncbi:PHD finger-containing protein 6-like isoform X2 [Humulus lupulus]|uniref:PHD finger-containing protein 6-like isoform X2 n=1 Tax=Humulus lupulus TaxID=3486 RepID=UPI002B40AD9B|nr:PHD finger-containing protein 6-like isoform X2 [Humulus lupulus]
MGSHCQTKEKVCEICGGGGNNPRYKLLLVTCSVCNITCEHIYCMGRKVKHEVPEDWICESCQSVSDSVLMESGKKDEAVTIAMSKGQLSVSQLHSKKQKPVETGKVKFIPHEEMIKLSSETFNESKASGKLHAHQKKSRDVILVPKNHCDISEKKMENSTKKSPLCSRPVDQGGVPRIISEKKHAAPCTKEPLTKRQHVSSKVGISNKKIEKKLVKESCTLLPSSLDVSAGGKTKDVQGDLPNFPLSFTLYITYFPAPDVTWKGGFSILNWIPCEFFSRFQAQLPCKVHPEVYKISRKMPPVLQVKMLPQCHFFADLFQDVCPDLLDVGMYFFPADNIERSRQSYVKLFEHMQVNESVMISYIDGVELLIFTSTQLNADSQNILSSESKQFLWGIFRSTNDKLLPSNAQEKLPTLVNSPDDDEDMEIDVPLIRKGRRFS